MGEGLMLIVMTASVALHELMHLLAARCVRVRVIELELMPFGGAARIDALWMVRPGQALAVALAGPACNLLLYLGASALLLNGWIEARLAAEIMRANLMVFLFNLIPALPLDGGRILCCLLSLRLSPGRAARLGVFLGWALGCALLAGAVMTALHGRFNITLAMSGGYILLSQRRERAQADGAAIRSLLERAHDLNAERVLPMAHLAASFDAPVRDIVARLRPRRIYRVAVYGGDMELIGFVGERRIVRALIDGDTRPIGALIEADDKGMAGLRPAPRQRA